MLTEGSEYRYTELGCTAVQKNRGNVTRYFFTTVIGTVDAYKKMYRFWYRRYFLDRFRLLDISVTFFEYT